MTHREVEQYLLQKSGVKKREMPRQQYVRITYYDALLATIEHTSEGELLNLYGTFEQMRKEYPSAVGNAYKLGKSFSGIDLQAMPDIQLKIMLDNAYEARCKQLQRIHMGSAGQPDKQYRIILPPPKMKVKLKPGFVQKIETVKPIKDDDEP